MHTKLKRRRPSYLLHGVRDPSSFVRTVLRLFARCRAFARSFGLSCGVAFERGVGKEMERMLGGGAVRAATSLPMHTASSGTVRAGCHRAWQGGDGIIRLALRILARSSKYVSLGLHASAAPAAGMGARAPQGDQINIKYLIDCISKYL